MLWNPLLKGPPPDVLNGIDLHIHRIFITERAFTGQTLYSCRFFNVIVTHMKPLDVVNSVDYGYRLAWAERGYLVRLAAVPFLVKLLCLMILQQLGWSHDYVRTAIVMLPSYFTEGWMLAHISRLVFLGQRWPFRPTGQITQDLNVLEDRAYGIMGGTVCYVLIQFLMCGFLSVLVGAQEAAKAQMATGQPPGDVTTFSMLGAMLLLVGTLWCFRLMFLYIPLSVGLGSRMIVRAPQSFMLSLKIMAIWLVCFVPPVLIAVYLTAALAPDTMDAANFPLRLVLVLLQVVADTLVAIIGTAAIASGLKEMITPGNGTKA